MELRLQCVCSRWVLTATQQIVCCTKPSVHINNALRLALCFIDTAMRARLLRYPLLHVGWAFRIDSVNTARLLNKGLVEKDLPDPRQLSRACMAFA